MKYFTMAIAALLLTTTAMAEVVFPPGNKNVQTAWTELCDITSLSCEGIKAPTVIFGKTGAALGYHYFGSSVVVITETCLIRTADFAKCDAIVLHEMAHYLFDQLGLADSKKACESEAFAWDVYNAYVLRINRNDLLRLDWVRSYPSCASPTLIP